MRVLAFDTCLNACSVALWDQPGCVTHWRRELMRQGHAERLCPMIDDMLAEAGIALASIDAIAVTVGPGTFTGIRVGIAAARGFALATGAKVLGTTSLALLAATARSGLVGARHGRPIAACHDARKGEVLVEIVRPGDVARLDRVHVLTPEMAARQIAASAPDALLVGSAAAVVAQTAAFAGCLLELGPADIEPDARRLADLLLVPLTTPTPLYPRPPDAKPPLTASLSRIS